MNSSDMRLDDKLEDFDLRPTTFDGETNRVYASGTGPAVSPVTNWLRALARGAYAECGGPGVGAVGMCFTGNFGLTMMLEPAVIAPVLCQPALPLNDEAGLESSPDELAGVRQRLERENLSVIALRFRDDPHCRAARFAAYADALGDRFEGHVIPDEAASRDLAPFFARFVPSPHSVVTQNLIDRAGEPTAKACDATLAFLAKRLLAQPAPATP